MIGRPSRGARRAGQEPRQVHAAISTTGGGLIGSVTRRLLTGLAVPAALLVLWVALWRLGALNQQIFPSPPAVISAWATWAWGPQSTIAWYSGTWLQYIGLSAWRVLMGFIIAGACGIFAGVLIGWYQLVRALFDPVLQALRPIPITAWLPFVTAIFGIRNASAVSLIALGAFFPILLNTTAGTRATPQVLIRAGLMLGTPPRRLLFRVALPSALPQIITGLRLGVGIAWVLVIVAEMLAVKGGLGYALWAAYQYSRMDLIVCDIVTCGVVGLLSDQVLILATKPLLRWAHEL